MIIAFSFLSLLDDDYKGAIEKFNSIANHEWLHYDVMDGLFVENKTFDCNLVKEISGYNKCFNDVHLMITEVNESLEEYLNSGADQITFHYEAISNKEDISEIINKIKSYNVKVGISIKPNTPIKMLDNYLHDVDYVLVMSVEPGKGGQTFIKESLSKIEYLKKKQKENYYLIGVDGGINEETSKLVKKAGADVIVMGTFLANNLNRDTISRCK